MAGICSQSGRVGRLSELLEGGPPWTEEEVLRLLVQLAVELRGWHQQGRLHRAVTPEQIVIDAQGHARLEPAPEPCRFGAGSFDARRCPPELAQAADVDLPEDLEAARAELAQVQADFDPRRIDVYQLGTLLWRLHSGRPVEDYIYDPTARAALRPEIREVLDRLLGCDTLNRLSNCAALVEVLEALLAQDRVTAVTPPFGCRAPAAADTPPGGHAAGSGPPPPAAAAQPDATPAPAAPPAAGLPFDHLGPYEIRGRIGHGGMGEVYEGYDPSLQRRVAIKVLPRELAQNEDFIRRFRCEAAAAAKIIHPNVITVHTIGEDQGRHFFAMQFVQGQSLDQRLRRGPRLELPETLHIARQCLAGLAAAHAAGLIHRDVKPANIILEKGTGRAVLVDFGLARSQQQSTELTATGVIMGTVDYLAPEQARGDRVDHRADLYSFGVVLYRMLAGRLPFQADTTAAMVFQHAYEQPFPLHEAAGDVPQPLIEVVSRLLAKDPAERYQSCSEVLEDLDAMEQGRPLAVRLPAASRLAGPASDAATALDDAAEFALPPNLAGLAQPGPWQRLRDRAATIFRRYAPEFVQELQGTAFQVDAAVAAYQRRRDRLAQLLAEARQAGAAEHIDDLELQLAKADTTLAQLAAQRDVLKARLKSAEGSLQRKAPPLRSVRIWLALAAGLVIVLAAAGWLPRPGRVAAPTAALESAGAGHDGEGRHAAPADAVAFENHYYKVYRAGVSWREAEAQCEQMGGRLACADSPEKKVFLASLRGGGVVWIGARRMPTGQWQWLNGQPCAEGEIGASTSAPGVRDYAAFTRGTQGNDLMARPLSGHMNALAAKNVGGFICEWGPAESGPPAAAMPEAAEAAVEAQAVPFIIQSNSFANGDKIVIEEVRSRLGSLAAGDTVIVKGTCTLQSRASATLVLSLSSAVRGAGAGTTVRRAVGRGTVPFEMQRLIECDGRLHLRLYDEQARSPLGDIYFGIEPQTKQISASLGPSRGRLDLAVIPPPIPPGFGAEAPAAGLAGEWEATLPSGATLRSPILRLDDNRYRFTKLGVFSGVYELRNERLIIVEPVDKRLIEFVWKVADGDSMVLIESSRRTGADYTGAVLKRVH